MSHDAESYASGYLAGLRAARKVAEETPVFERQIPLRTWLRCFMRPQEVARRAAQFARAKIARRINERTEDLDQ